MFSQQPASGIIVSNGFGTEGIKFLLSVALRSVTGRKKWLVLISYGWALTTEPLVIKRTKLELGTCKTHASCDITISNLVSVGSLTDSSLSSPAGFHHAASALLHVWLLTPRPHAPTPRSFSTSMVMPASKNPTSLLLYSCFLPLPDSGADVCLHNTIRLNTEVLFQSC